MPNCKFFISDSDTPRDGIGQCHKITDYLNRGGTIEKAVTLASDFLNGGVRTVHNTMLFKKSECNEQRGCAKFEAVEDAQ
jgi:hypothetical protein